MIVESAKHLLLTHYYHRAEKPFQTLSTLPDHKALELMTRLGKRTGAVYRRFKHPQKYLRHRQLTESWLRQEFIQKGGQPVSAYPQYFSVGASPWMEEGYNEQSKIVQFPLSSVSPVQVSFTYPDSMVSYWLRTQSDKAFYQSAYHGQVFILDEILQVIEQFGMPGDAWRTNPARKHDIFIEAQLWSDLPNH
ncbi:hypothetical protein [cf. Phormidesmis sp. LEGE 11477]|uniref:hypothetical protein n=1 Tax=cf. Phormidesmis sp. LEGE 11477 TaxID=1828680 RepID=UPI00187F5648|nr:hypothetical protein [cf. Phormidesmis sp. LEGE 11477]MBE9061066.1 hypothetical protein [cf. Phormidesmis sp. LEGE 11477]